MKTFESRKTFGLTLFDLTSHAKKFSAGRSIIKNVKLIKK